MNCSNDSPGKMSDEGMIALMFWSVISNSLKAHLRLDLRLTQQELMPGSVNIAKNLCLEKT